MKIYKKKCPSCKKEQFYSSYSALWLANKNNSNCRSCAKLKQSSPLGSAVFLLSKTLLSYYWLGFILADGSISNNRLRVSLGEKDRHHLEKLANILGIKVHNYTYDKKIHNYIYYKYKTVSISLMDTQHIQELVNLYQIKHNKTYNPPNIDSIIGNNLKALSIGFIDGDGCITKSHNRRDFRIGIKLHASWLNFLEYVFQKGYIDNQGYAQTAISNTTECKKLKIFAIDNQLPILKRKWDKIDLNYISIQERAKERVILVKQMLGDHVNRKKIMAKTALSASGLSLLIKRNNL